MSLPLDGAMPWEDKVAATPLRSLLVYNYKYMDKKASTSSDTIRFLLTSLQKVLQGYNTAPLKTNTPKNIKNIQDGHAQLRIAFNG